MPSDNSTIIHVQDLIKHYKKADKSAVDGVSFDVAAGSFFALLGPNGAGKTTTISVLTTTLSKTSGEVTIDGYDVETQATEVRSRIGIIFQNPSLDLNLTAEENVRLHAILYGVASYRPTYSLMPDSYKKKVDELADILDITKDLHKPIKTFSGGMKRKLEIIRSLIHNPSVLFWMNPPRDSTPRAEGICGLTCKISRKKHNMTIFLTTHYLEEAEGADQVCVMNHGKIVAHGSPAQLKSSMIKNYVSIKAKDMEGLTRELAKKKISFTNREKSIDIACTDSKIHGLLKSIDTPITSVQIHTPSLEEAYLEIIGEKIQTT
ncbi:MAG: Daunorubicin/doxorubicin resistance ATP-binding protein DrrA [Microgenomates bacterium OLB22]|nr:MAG: Daunorubicin/doxorubicin resistance ATP-binding protein DrrA [Microgenomates bacterium OLB22]